MLRDYTAGGRGDGYCGVQRAGLRGGGGGGHHALPHTQPLPPHLLAGQHGQGGQEDHRARAAQGEGSYFYMRKITYI